MWRRRLRARRADRRIQSRVYETTEPEGLVNPTGDGPLSRHELLGGFSQIALRNASIALVGTGGVGGQVADGLARKAIGRMVLQDGDSVSLSNLNRQPFTPDQVGKNKAHALAEGLITVATGATTIVAQPWYFPDQRGMPAINNCQIVVCGVDGDTDRAALASWAFERVVPLIVVAVTYNADFGYCFVQEPGSACFGCLDPGAFASPRTTPCVVGSSIDILKVMGGLALYAIDSLLMDRPRSWNYKEVSLDGDRSERQLVLPRAEDCPLCGSRVHRKDRGMP